MSNVEDKIEISEKEKQYRIINDEYNKFTYLFYEASRRGGNFTSKDLNKQIERLILKLETMKNMR